MIIKFLNKWTTKPKEFDDLRNAEKHLKETDLYSQNFYIHKIPTLPKWTDKNLKCQNYLVNPFLFKCNCNEFKNDRAIQYKELDIRRCCRHLYYKLNDHKYSQFVDSLTMKLAYGTAFKNERYFYKYTIYNQLVIFGFIPNSDWTGVYTQLSSKNFFRYSYNPIIKKWAEHLIPVQETFIIDQFMKAIKYQLPYTHKLLKIQSIK